MNKKLYEPLKLTLYTFEYVIHAFSNHVNVVNELLNFWNELQIDCDVLFWWEMFDL
jgi:hypothetical protein